jgi:flagellar basal body-associated protein FliL
MDCKGFTESVRTTTNSSLTNTPENSYSTKYIVITIILTVITITFFAIVVFMFYWLNCKDKNNSNSREKTTNDEMEEQIEEIQSAKTLFQKSSLFTKRVRLLPKLLRKVSKKPINRQLNDRQI